MEEILNNFISEQDFLDFFYVTIPLMTELEAKGFGKSKRFIMLDEIFNLLGQKPKPATDEEGIQVVDRIVNQVCQKYQHSPATRRIMESIMLCGFTLDEAEDMAPEVLDVMGKKIKKEGGIGSPSLDLERIQGIRLEATFEICEMHKPGSTKK